MADKEQKPEETQMASMPPIPTDLMRLIVFIAGLAAGFDAGNQNKSEAVIGLFEKSRFVVDEPLPGERKPPH